MPIDVSPDSSQNRFRRRRIETFLALTRDYLAVNETCTVIDVGGTSGFWHVWREVIDFERVHITCVNLDPTFAADAADAAGFDAVTVRAGDARDLSDWADNSFDIAFSNSVIEHVGGWPDMVDAAGEIRRLAQSYMVQTPYFWFPIEPHARTAFFHWLPHPLACRLAMARPLGFYPKARTMTEAFDVVREACLLDQRQFRDLFPDGELHRERFLGVVKSLIAIRHPVDHPAGPPARQRGTLAG